MNRQSILLSLAISFLGPGFLSAQNTNKNIAIKKQLEETNALLTQSFVNKNIANAIQFYNENVIYMPEYQATLKGTKQVREYLVNQSKKREYKAFTKNTTEVYTIKNRAVEIGIFSISFRNIDESKIENLTGKYMCIWDISDKQIKSFAKLMAISRMLTTLLILW